MTRPLSQFSSFPTLPDPATDEPPHVSRSMSLPVHIEPNSFQAREWQRARVILEFGTLRPAQWPSFCAEIMLEPTRTAEICERYGIDPADATVLMKHNEQFEAIRAEVRAKLDKYVAEGKDGFLLRAALMSEELLPELRDIAKDKSNTGPTRVRAIENVMELAEYRNKPGTGGNGRVAGGSNAGVVMNVSFGAGLPTIEALTGVQDDGRGGTGRVRLKPTITVQPNDDTDNPRTGKPEPSD